jgi:hypothetical protein
VQTNTLHATTTSMSNGYFFWLSKFQSPVFNAFDSAESTSYKSLSIC